VGFRLIEDRVTGVAFIVGAVSSSNANGKRMTP
jgi:hypothetical protein